MSSGPEVLEKLVYLVLVQVNEEFAKRRLPGLAEIRSGSCHTAQTQNETLSGLLAGSVKG